MSSDEVIEQADFEDPLQDTREYQENEERQHWIFGAIASTVVLAAGFVVFLSFYSLKDGLDGWIIVGINAASLALLLASAYFFAFRFFDDLFYLFLSIGWLANAAYLPFEFLFKSECTPSVISSNCFNFSIYTYGLSFVSSISFFVATLTRRERTESVSIWPVLSYWAICIMSATGIGFLINYLWLAGDSAFRFAVITTPGVIFSAYGLYRVGNRVSWLLRPAPKTRDRTFGVLSASFYAYAALQLTYPFKLYLLKADASVVFIGLFVLAFGIKFANVYCLVKVLLQVKYPEFLRTKSELEAAQERLGRQSQLAALGAIAASIEHDMKTPLSGISTNLEEMRHIYPDKRIKEYIELLEADKNRIAAIAKVVPFMRGAEEFYDRDRFMEKESINALVNRAMTAVKAEMSLDPQKYFFRITPNPKKSKHNTEYFVRAYAPMIEQMMVNFFKNAIEAIRETGRDNGVIAVRMIPTRSIPPKISAKYDLKKIAKWIRVDIEDNGCGIAEENIPKLTSLFTTKNDRKPNGGIGLFIARILIRTHEGCMNFISTEGHGATVSVYLPEWEAYQEYATNHVEALNDYEFDEDVEALEAPSGADLEIRK